MNPCNTKATSGGGPSSTRSVRPIPRITQPRQDEALLVQPLIDGRRPDRHVIMEPADALEAIVLRVYDSR